MPAAHRAESHLRLSRLAAARPRNYVPAYFIYRRECCSLMLHQIRLICVFMTFLSLFAHGVAMSAETQPASQPAEPQTRQGNVFGIGFGWEPGWSTVGTNRLLGVCRHLVGEWGYLRSGIGRYDDLDAVERSVAMIRAHHLIYLGGGAQPLPEHREEGKPWPKLEADGTTQIAAQARAQTWRRLYNAGIPFYAVEVLNEVNINWEPERYAQWLFDFGVAVKAAYPGIKVCSAGMAGAGEDFYDKMLTFKPELKAVVDFWGLHPYGANNPPEAAPGGTNLRDHELTIRVLEKHGVDPIRLMCTETGYELEIGDTGKNPAHPPINEKNRAEYMARAFRDYYIPEQRIEMVSPFMLWDFPWGGWTGWTFMYPDGTPRPIYEAIAAIPKSGGRDWVETGKAEIHGRVTVGGTDIGVPRAIVYAKPDQQKKTPALYAAVTGDDGRYQITGMPDDSYRLQVFADGFTSSPTSRLIAVKSDRPVTYPDIALGRVSLVPGQFSDATGGHPPGWSPMYKDMPGDTFRVVPGSLVGGPTLQVELSRGTQFGLWRYGSYNSAYPFEMYLAEVYVWAEKGRVLNGAGPWFQLEISNGGGEILSTARVRPIDFKCNGQRHRLTAALLAPPSGSRVRLAFGVDGAEGTFYFSEPFVGEADFPLPTDGWFMTAGYVPPRYEENRRFFAQAVTSIAARKPDLHTTIIRGTVTDFRNRPLANATVASDSPCFVAVTNERGEYELTVPVSTHLNQPIRVRAFAQNAEPAVSKELGQLREGREVMLNLQTEAPPAPKALQNGGFNTFAKNAPGLVRGWTTFGYTDGAAPAPYIFVKDVTPFEGEGLFFAGSGSNVKNGGVYQVVAVERGARCSLSAQCQTITEGGGKRKGDNTCRIGIDPTGGVDQESSDIVWSEAIESERKWSPIAVDARALTERVTIFVHHQMRRANTWNLTVIDDVQLSVEE